MELAIPLLALGGMYVISNQTPQNKQPLRNQNNIKMKHENFTNMGKQTNYLPNTDIPPQNFPVSNINQLVDTVQEYPNPNSATDKYFDQNNYEKRVNQGKPGPTFSVAKGFTLLFRIPGLTRDWKKSL